MFNYGVGYKVSKLRTLNELDAALDPAQEVANWLEVTNNVRYIHHAMKQKDVRDIMGNPDGYSRPNGGRPSRLLMRCVVAAFRVWVWWYYVRGVEEISSY